MSDELHKGPQLLRWLKSRFRRKPVQSAELVRGSALLAAIDAGGIPLNPARVNQLARDLGLEVSKSAPVEETIERIRAAVARGKQASSGPNALQ